MLVVYCFEGTYVLKKNHTGVYRMKRFVVILFALCLAFAVIGCASPPPAQPQQTGLPDIVRNARRNAPEGVLIGIGQARMATPAQSRTFAENRARAEIARALDSMVSNMIEDYVAGSEVDHSAVVSFQQEVTQSLARSRIQGAVIADEDWVDGTYYVVMHLSKADVAREITQAQAQAQLAVPAMAASLAIDRMDAAFDRQSAQELRVADRD